MSIEFEKESPGSVAAATSSNRIRVFVDPADDLVKTKDDVGAVTTIAQEQLTDDSILAKAGSNPQGSLAIPDFSVPGRTEGGDLQALSAGQLGYIVDKTIFNAGATAGPATIHNAFSSSSRQVRIAPNTDIVTLTGIDAPNASDNSFYYWRVLWNDGTTNLVLSHENAGSVASNRFRLPGATDYTVAPGEAVSVVYDASGQLRWFVVAAGAAGTSSGLAFDTAVQALSFNAVAGKIMRWDSEVSGITASLPSSPSADDRVGFYEDGPNANGTNKLTVSGNGKVIDLTVGRDGVGSIQFVGVHSYVECQFDADRDGWRVTNGWLHPKVGNGANGLVSVDEFGALDAINPGENSAVARVGTGITGAVSLGTDGVLGRSEGNDLKSLSKAELGYLVDNTIFDEGALAGPQTLNNLWGNTGARYYKVAPNTDVITVTGLDAPTASDNDQYLWRVIRNYGTTDLVLAHEDTGSGPTNRFDLPGDVDYTVGPDEYVQLFYDTTATRWIIPLPPAGSGGISATLFDANTILKADSDDTPVALTVGTNAVLGRQGADITAISVGALRLLGRSLTGDLGPLEDYQALHILLAGIAGQVTDSTTGTEAAYAPGGFDGAYAVHWTGASLLTIQGMDRFADSTVPWKRFTNGGTANVVFAHESGSAVATERIACPGAVDFTLAPTESIVFQYNFSTSRWILLDTISSGVQASLFDANTILKADSDDTPVALTVSEETVLGRQTGGVIAALDSSQVLSLLQRQATDYLVDTTSAGSVAAYAPTGWSGAISVLFAGGPGALTLQGLDVTFTTDVLIKKLTNFRLTDVVLAHEDVGAAAVDRFNCPGSVDYRLAHGESVFIQYDLQGARWAVVAMLRGVEASIFDANTILKADSDDTPVALTVAEETVLGRQTSGSISALAVGEDELVARPAGGNVGGLAVAASRIVGRTAAGALGGLTAADALSVLFPGQTFLDATVQTTDATVTTIATYSTLADERVIELEFTVVGREATDDTIRQKFLATFNRDGASAVTSLDEVVTSYESAGASAWDVTLAVSSQDVLIRVTGEAAHTIEWRVLGKVFEHGA